MLSPPSVCRLWRIGRNSTKFGVWVTHINRAYNGNFFWPAPWGGVERSNILVQLQSQFQRFLYQTLCVFSQMKDTKHVRRIFILSPGSCPRGQNQIPSCCLSVMLLNHWTKFNQIRSPGVWVTLKQQFFLGPAPWGPGEGSKGQIFNFNYKVNFQVFLYCVCSYKWKIHLTYQKGFSFCCQGHVPGVGIWVAGGAQVVKKMFKHDHVAYYFDEDEEQNRMQVKLSS